jgi:hypothetical protein
MAARFDECVDFINSARESNGICVCICVYMYMHIYMCGFPTAQAKQSTPPLPPPGFATLL